MIEFLPESTDGEPGETLGKFLYVLHGGERFIIPIQYWPGHESDACYIHGAVKTDSLMKEEPNRIYTSILIQCKFLIHIAMIKTLPLDYFRSCTDITIV